MSALLHGLGSGLSQGFAMFWETLWALVLGFTISGAVQAFVSRGQMERALGRRSPAVLVRATFLGSVSSSCSYAASAMAKSLFAKGADLTAAVVFMVASTNLVIELGIVLALLIGWQFTASEVVGGLLMVVLIGVLARAALPAALVDRARARLERAEPAASGVADGGAAPARMRTLAGWTDAASYTVADVTMVRRELLVGFGVAGFLALVPTDVWAHLFISGHGLLSSLENVAVGPLIAILSFVCSIGNVPLAAALWRGGISFGGVVAFIFADLITLPLLLIYRRYYGTALTVRILAMLWLAMSLSGLAVEYLFRALGLVPRTRPATIASGAVAWNATTVLDVVAIAVFAALYMLHRNRARLGGGTRHALDPVCGMQVERATAPARRSQGDGTVYFCSDHCAERYDRRAVRDSVPELTR